MRLKIATTACLIFSALALLSWPWTVGPKPPDSAPKAELQAYAVRLMAYFGVLVFALFVTVALALLVIRNTRLEFKKRSLDNLQDLVESTLKDHAAKRDS